MHTQYADALKEHADRPADPHIGKRDRLPLRIHGIHGIDKTVLATIHAINTFLLTFHASFKANIADLHFSFAEDIGVAPFFSKTKKPLMRIHEQLSSNKTDYKSTKADKRAFVLTKIFRIILSTSLSDILIIQSKKEPCRYGLFQQE